jgi:hypothetical protein
MQAPEMPSGTFAEVLQRRPALAGQAAAGPAQRMELFAQGASIGWLGEDSGQWCVVASAEAAVSIAPYVYNGVLYYRNAADTSRYLSVSDGYHYVGFYNWLGARGWTLTGNVLTSLYTNAQLSYWSSDNGYVYANSASGYTPLTVTFH